MALERYDIGEVKTIVIRTQRDALRRARYFLSTRGAHYNELLAALDDDRGRRLLEDITDLLMLHFGHANEERSETRKAVRRALKAG